MILGRWHPLKPLSRKAPAQGEITLRVYRMVNQGWKLFLGLFGGIILQDGTPEASWTRDAQTWISHVPRAGASPGCLQPVLAMDPAMRSFLFINSSFVSKTCVVKTCSAPNDKGRICHLGLMRCWQRAELVLGILHISFPPLETTEAREAKKQSKTTYCLYFLFVSKRGGIMQTPINPMALLGENPVVFGRGCWQKTGSIESVVLLELFITIDSAGVGGRWNGRQLEF